jgi:phage/plasmid-like protein (TIGR03299 family)
MPAYFETGFSVRQPMWHGQGLVLDDYPTDWADARQKAGLMWEPTYADLYVQQVVPACCRSCTENEGGTHASNCPLWSDANNGRVGKQAIGPEQCVPVRRLSSESYLVHVPASGHQAIVRDDTWAVLATPTDSYKLIQHHQMGDLLDAYTAAWRKLGASIKFETAGSIRGGGMVWALVWLDEPYHVPGDDSPTYPFAALLNYHDGTGSCRLLPTAIRIVCWNTWKMAEYGAEARNESIVIRHTGNVEARLEDAKASLATVRDDAKEWQLAAADLAALNINDAVVATFLDEFIPIPEGASERTRANRAKRQETFRKLYTMSPTVAPLPETGYKLVQAAGEYLDHLRPFHSQDTYLARTMFHAEPVKRGVIKLVRTLAADLA